MKIVAIVQARMGSTRLPGKVLKTLGGKSVLAQVLGRVRSCRTLTSVAVATSTLAEDEAVVDEAKRCGAVVVRGDALDVLARYGRAADETEADVVVRVTSDCPLFDGGLLETMLGAFLAGRAAARPLDYLSNTIVRSYPRGLDCEIFTRAALKRAVADARTPSQREHVTPYFYQNPTLFSVEQFARLPDLSHHRWTLDTPEDWALLSRVFEALGPCGEIFETERVLSLLAEKPEWVALNAGVEQKKVLPQD